MSEGRPTIDPARPEGSERLGIMGGFRSETHVVVALWSAEALHIMRLREQTFRAVCSDPPDSFAAWWAGSPSTDGPSTSSLVIFDPLTAGGARAADGSALTNCVEWTRATADTVMPWR